MKNGLSGNSVNIVNSANRRHLTDGELPSSSSRARGHLRLHAGMGRLLHGFFMLLGRFISRDAVIVLLRFIPLFFPSSPLNSVELAPSPLNSPSLCIACHSSTYSLQTQPTSPRLLFSPRNAARRPSSSRPAASPSNSRHRGQHSTVRLCPC